MVNQLWSLLRSVLLRSCIPAPSQFCILLPGVPVTATCLFLMIVWVHACTHQSLHTVALGHRSDDHTFKSHLEYVVIRLLYCAFEIASQLQHPALIQHLLSISHLHIDDGQHAKDPCWYSVGSLPFVIHLLLMAVDST